jgi:phosphatidylglycerophosphatase A
MIFTESLNITQISGISKLNDTLQQAPRPRLAVWLATGLGIGLVVPAPGTFGAAWGSLLAWGMSYLPGVGWQIAAIALLLAVGVPLCTAASRALGLGKDPGPIIWDEIVTVPIVFLAVPMTNWRIALAGFFLHRFFDITKPPPARQLERLPEGTGIMADDVAAAIYACLLLCAIAWLDRANGWALLSMGGG